MVDDLVEQRDNHVNCWRRCDIIGEELRNELNNSMNIDCFEIITEIDPKPKILSLSKYKYTCQFNATDLISLDSEEINTEDLTDKETFEMVTNTEQP